MTDLIWLCWALAIGFALGVATLPWRFKWSNSSTPVYLGLWMFAWPGLILIGGAMGYYRAWIDYLREVDRRRHLPPPETPRFPAGHDTLR